jgi:hypothetical protein
VQELEFVQSPIWVSFPFLEENRQRRSKSVNEGRADIGTGER